jgi:hypothetical protein
MTYWKEENKTVSKSTGVQQHLCEHQNHHPSRTAEAQVSFHNKSSPAKEIKSPFICTKKLSLGENTFDCLKKKKKNSLFGKSKLPKKKQIQFISGSLIFLFKILFCGCVDVWLFH